MDSWYIEGMGDGLNAQLSQVRGPSVRAGTQIKERQAHRQRGGKGGRRMEKPHGAEDGTHVPRRIVLIGGPGHGPSIALGGVLV